MPIHGNGGHAAVVRELTFTPPDGWIIAVGDNTARQMEARKFRHLATGIHPSASVSPTATVGAGTVVMMQAAVQAFAVIGKHCILNTGCSVDHHSILGDFVHVAPGARLCGAVKVGAGAFIGAGAVCLPGSVVEPWSLVKAGTVHR